MFIPCIAFDGLASMISNHVEVGDRVSISGKLIHDKYGKTDYCHKLQVARLEFGETFEEHDKHVRRQLKKSIKEDLNHEC